MPASYVQIDENFKKENKTDFYTSATYDKHRLIEGGKPNLVLQYMPEQIVGESVGGEVKVIYGKNFNLEEVQLDNDFMQEIEHTKDYSKFAYLQYQAIERANRLYLKEILNIGNKAKRGEYGEGVSKNMVENYYALFAFCNVVGENYKHTIDFERMFGRRKDSPLFDQDNDMKIDEEYEEWLEMQPDYNIFKHLEKWKVLYMPLQLTHTIYNNPKKLIGKGINKIKCRK